MQSSATALVVCSVLFPCLALLALVIRIAILHARQKKPKIEDYLITAAWVITAGMGSADVVGVYQGHFGQEFETISMSEQTIFTKIIFAMQFFHLFAMAFIKFSMIIFFKRIFITRSFQIQANIMLAIVSCWLIAFFWTTLFQAWPISQNWTGVGNTILNEPAMYLALGVIDVVTDFMILCLPIPVIIRLHADWTKRIMVLIVFGVGFFCIAASCVRVWYLEAILNTDQATIDEYGSVVQEYVTWTLIEPAWSIICVSLPIILPACRTKGQGKGLSSLIANLQSAISLRSRSSNRSTGKLSNVANAHGKPFDSSNHINVVSSFTIKGENRISEESRKESREEDH